MTTEELRALIRDMSLQEKIAQVSQIGMESFFANSTEPTGPMRKFHLSREQMLQAGSLIGAFGIDEQQQQEIRRLVGETKHRIPPLIMCDVIHGMRSIFPIPLGMGASFSEKNAEIMARTSAEEATARGIHVTFAPMADVVRDPRWGRCMESFGESPALCGRMSAAAVRGFHGPDESAPDGLASCVKHFAAYGLVEAGQDYGHVDVSRVEMYNTYLPPFKAALDAGCDMLMPAFTPVDRVPATANRWLIGQVLRQQWAWDGMIITDWGSIDMMLVQAFAESMEEAVEQAFNNTVDMDMMSYAYFSCLEKLIREGKVREEKLDASVLRILELKNRLGLMDDSRQPQPAPTAEQVSENRRKTLQAALQSCVLMKNDGVLPLKPGVHLALAGSHADEHGLLGGWHTDGRNEETPSLLDAFRAEKNVTLCKPEEADVILFACGEQQDLTGEACSRAYPKLEEEQLQELYALSELGKPIVMVLFCGRALVLSDALPFCNALLNAWFPGSEGAEAIRRLLVGEENPSGHLPVTFPRCTGQIPIHHDRIPTGRPYTTEENRYSCRYLDEKNAPLFPFGFGLSYTQFEISDICADTDVIQANEPFHVTAKVRNAGNRAGETVIQLYSNVHVPGQLTPVRSLTDWQRICLGVGQQMEVTFELTLAQLSQLDAEGRAVTPRGKVRIAVGEDSRAPFTVTLPVEA